MCLGISTLSCFISPLVAWTVSIDRTRFRHVMGRFLTGVTAVTSTTPDGLHGLTANAFCRVSDSPPLVLVSLDRLARGRDYVLASGCYAVSILSEGQEFLADRLAGRAPGLTRHFEGIPYTSAVTGAPILRGCVAWLDCWLEASHEAGDHTLFVGRVADLGVDEALLPLLFFRGAYTRLER